MTLSGIKIILRNADINVEKPVIGSYYINSFLNSYSLLDLCFLVKSNGSDNNKRCRETSTSLFFTWSSKNRIMTKKNCDILNFQTSNEGEENHKAGTKEQKHKKVIQQNWKVKRLILNKDLDILWLIGHSLTKPEIEATYLEKRYLI